VCVLGAETPASGASKVKETTPVQEFVAPPSEESRQKTGVPTELGKPAAARGKTEPKAVKEPATSAEMTAGKPAAAASQVISCSDYDDL